MATSGATARVAAVAPFRPAAASVPSTMVRGAGVYFPPNGKFYVLGGRTDDSIGSDILHPYEYDRFTDTWTQKASTFPDTYVNNMACAVLTVFVSPVIACVGGSPAGLLAVTGRVVLYDPIGDEFLTLSTADDWPPTQSRPLLPGGFAVVHGVLYILGGYDTVGPFFTSNQTWAFDPQGDVGAKWTQKAALVPSARGYVPAAAIGTKIYTAGGTVNINGLADSTESFVYDTVADTYTWIASIPRATGETRAVPIGGKMWVLGGGRTPPNPSAEVDVYNPLTDTWTTASPLKTARRNAAIDTDGYHVFIAGGYTNNPGTPVNAFEDDPVRTIFSTTNVVDVWNRPDANGTNPPNALSPYGTAVPYGAATFAIATPGTYVFQMTATSPNWDTYAFLYQNSFDPAAPLTNVLIGNDDEPVIGASGFAINLAAGTYVFVATGFWNFSHGNYSLSVAGPAAVGFPFADTPIVAGTTIVRATHITQLRVRVDWIRSRFGMTAYPWTNPAIVRGVTTVQAQHILDLRAAIAEVYTAAGWTLPTYTGATPAAGIVITAAHINEIRAAVIAAE